MVAKLTPSNIHHFKIKWPSRLNNKAVTACLVSKSKTCHEFVEGRSTSMTTLKLFYFVVIGQLPLISNEGKHGRIETNRFVDNGN